MGRHKPHSRHFSRFFSDLGPGLITGAADDDPSGISTYSVTGAAFGYTPLWTALFSFPLMVSVQLMSARLGMVSGRGLAAVVRRKYPPWVLWSACLLLTVTFLSLVKAFTTAGAFRIYAVLCVFTVWFVWRLTPETKGKKLEEIEKQWIP